MSTSFAFPGRAVWHPSCTMAPKGNDYVVAVVVVTVVVVAVVLAPARTPCTQHWMTLQVPKDFLASLTQTPLQQL